MYLFFPTFEEATNCLNHKLTYFGNFFVPIGKARISEIRNASYIIEIPVNSAYTEIWVIEKEIN